MADNVAVNAFTSFWNSKRGMLCLALIIAATVLAVLSVFSADQWIDYTKWIFGFYVGGESITAAAQHIASAKKTAATEEVTATFKSTEPVAPPAGGAS